MIFIVNIVKYGIVALFGLLLIISTMLIFWSFTSTSTEFIAGYSIIGVLMFLSAVVAALFGTAVLISIHDSILKISVSMERIADTASSLGKVQSAALMGSERSDDEQA